MTMEVKKKKKNSNAMNVLMVCESGCIGTQRKRRESETANSHVDSRNPSTSRDR